MPPDISAVIEILLSFWEMCFNYIKYLNNRRLHRPLSPFLLIGLINIITFLQVLFQLNTEITKWRKKILRSYNAIRMINGYRLLFSFDCFKSRDLQLKLSFLHYWH